MCIKNIKNIQSNGYIFKICNHIKFFNESWDFFFFQNNTILQKISLVNTIFKLFRKLISRVC